MKKLNVGCGQNPTSGWINYDNSICVKLAKVPFLISIVKTLKVLGVSRLKFVMTAKHYKIKWADIREYIPEASGSVDVIYLSHVLENLYLFEINSFLKEAFRVLKPGGIIRICAMDIKKYIDKYNRDSDTDALMSTFFSSRSSKPKNLDKVSYLIFGDRNRKWYFDANSLQDRLEGSGFCNAQFLLPGKTNISDSGALDLFEQIDESMYIEAFKPGEKVNC
jgi:SAM-dependent methyltransferase